MVGDEDADVSVLQAPHYVLDVLHGDGVYTGERLVEHDELGVDGKASGNLRAPAFATGEAVADVLPHLLQPELFNQALKFLYLLLARKVGHLKHGEDVVLDTQLAEDARLLRQIAYSGPRTLVHGEVGNVLVIYIYVARVGHDKAGRHIERGCLACSVGAEQTHNLALTHVD